MSALLQIRGLHAYYGKSHILHGVDLDIGKGEIVSLLGRNGAGRSTLAKAIMGQVRATGLILFNNEPVLGLRACQIARKGIGYVPENRQIFPALSVDQNLLLGEKTGINATEPTQRWCLQDMYQLFPQLSERRTIAAGRLSGGEQQMLTLCRTLMGNPALIIIDEPMEGLAPKIAVQVAECFGVLKIRGVSILLIEQKRSIALTIAQKIAVIGRGTIVFEGPRNAFDAADAIRAEWLEV